MTSDGQDILRCEGVPILVQRLRAIRSAPGIEHLCVFAVAFPIVCQKEESLAEMEDALHPQAELADAALIGGLAVLAKGADAARVGGIESSVVDEEQCRRPKQGVGCVRQPSRAPEPKPGGLRVVGVLNQLLEQREA